MSSLDRKPTGGSRPPFRAWLKIALAVAAFAFLVVPFRASLSPNELSPDAFIETAKLSAGDGAAHDQFGFSAAISGDYAVVGAPRDEGSRGAAYIFQRVGSTWTAQQKLTADDAAVEDSFGWSVAMDGSTVVVGAYRDDLASADQGSVYVFTRSGSTWTQQQKIVTADAAASDQFGISVAISGETIIAGAVGDDSYRGSAYVFTRSGTTWSQEQKLAASDGAGDDDFGWSVGLDGDTSIVGSPRDDASRGSAFIFTRNGASWAQQQKLAASDGSALDQFGYSVAVDGESAVVGAVNDVDGGILRGSAYVFIRSGGSWSEQQKLTSADGGANDRFGTSVSISGDSLVVGADGHDLSSAPDAGAAYDFGRNGSVWVERQKLNPSDAAAGDAFGSSVSINGANAVVGAPLDDGVAADTGSAYAFNRSTITPTPTPTPTPGPPVTVSGRVLRPSGQALANTRVLLIRPDGTRLIATTSSFGIFSFANVPSGITYTLTVPPKRYRFAPLTITPMQNMSGLELIGLE